MSRYHLGYKVVLEKAYLPSIEAMLMLRQLHWTDDVARMVDSRMSKFVFYGERSYGKRSIGAPSQTLRKPAEATASLR